MPEEAEPGGGGGQSGHQLSLNSCVTACFCHGCSFLGIRCAHGEHLHDLLEVRAPGGLTTVPHWRPLCGSCRGPCTEGAVGSQAGDSQRSLLCMARKHITQIPTITFPGLLQPLGSLSQPLPLTMIACLLAELLAGGGSVLHLSISQSPSTK